MKLINIGCGAVFHPDWLNLDVEPCDTRVMRWDVRIPLPVQDGSADMVYHSHVLEHLTATEAVDFLKECARVLKPGGVLRVVVPDLEGIARAYLGALKAADPVLTDWTRLEVTDQLTRSRSGGDMAMFLRSLDAAGRSIVRERAGLEVDHVLAQAGKRRPFELWRAWRRARRDVLRGVAWILGGARWKVAVDEGLFRAEGEVHRVMYDRGNLACLLKVCGFIDTRVVAASESRIAGFGHYELDVINGMVRKPDSLFMEGVRA